MSRVPAGPGLSAGRWIILLLSAVAGFIARGQLIAGPATLLRYLIALFVSVFLFALAVSALSTPVQQEEHPELEAVPHPGLEPGIGHETALEAR